MQIFLTGATGFIGTHLIQRLAGTGHELRCLVRRTSDTSQLEAAGARICVGDVGDAQSLGAAADGCQWVVHLANLYSFWERDPRRSAAVNIEGTRNVMRAAVDAGVGKVVHVSSVVAYGRPQDTPFVEDSAPGPGLFSEYARTKQAGDRLAREVCNGGQVPLVVLYPAAVLGPGDRKASGQYIADLVHRRLPATLLDRVVLTWVHVADVAEAIVRALEKEGTVDESYLVGKHQLSVGELNQMVSEISGVALPRLRIPDPLAMPLAGLLTRWADLTGKPPKWGLARDYVATVREGIEAEGSRAERELGLEYTPIRTALEQMLATRTDAPC